MPASGGLLDDPLGGEKENEEGCACGRERSQGASFLYSTPFHPNSSLDLTKAWLGRKRRGLGNPSSSVCENTGNKNDDREDDDIPAKLRETFQRWGWCRVHLSWPVDETSSRVNDDGESLLEVNTAGGGGRAPESPVLANSDLLPLPHLWKPNLMELFPPSEDRSQHSIMTTTITHGDYQFMYRTHESGQAGSGTREPKQSWEVAQIAPHLSSSPVSFHAEDGKKKEEEKHSLGPPREKNPVLTRVARLLPNWAAWMHTVAGTVTQAVDLPRNAWLVEPDDLSGTPPDRLDLLRAFLYETTLPPPSAYIPQRKSSHPSSSPSNPEKIPAHPDLGQEGHEMVWGSSPHSDWGTFTVIWQDDVGGLCVQCPRCGTWRPVTPCATPPIPEQHEIVHLIILVGDLTSLAMNLHAQQAAAAATFAPADLTTTDLRSPLWPSPRHGVLCPQQGPPRVSLVYFCYPPPHQTLDGMIDQLSRVNSSDAGRRCEFGRGWATPEDEHLVAPPLSSYSLLQNQAVQLELPVEPLDDDNLGRLDKHLQSIRYQPVASVLAAKWEQVQRSY